MSSAKVINFDLPKSRYVVPTRILFIPNWSASHIDFMLLLYIFNNNSGLKFKISKRYLKADNRFQSALFVFSIC